MTVLLNSVLTQMNPLLQRLTASPGNEDELTRTLSSAIMGKLTTSTPPASVDPRLWAEFHESVTAAHRYLGYDVGTPMSVWLVGGGLAAVGVGLLGGIFWLTRR